MVLSFAAMMMLLLLFHRETHNKTHTQLRSPLKCLTVKRVNCQGPTRRPDCGFPSHRDPARLWGTSSTPWKCWSPPRRRDSLQTSSKMSSLFPTISIRLGPSRAQYSTKQDKNCVGTNNTAPSKCIGTAWSLPFVLHILAIPSFWKRLIFSSVIKTLFQNFSGSPLYYCAKPDMAFQCFSSISSLHLVVMACLFLLSDLHAKPGGGRQ